jgi:hypothetical protein
MQITVITKKELKLYLKIIIKKILFLKKIILFLNKISGI